MKTIRKNDGWKKRRHLREYVRFAQRLVRTVSFLPVGVDGAFGPAFEKAIYAFQRGRGLYEDGVVGDEVWTELSESMVPFWDGKLEPSVLYCLTGKTGAEAKEWAAGFDQAFEYADISTPSRQAHFLSQCAVESDRFRALEEYASGQAYEGRKDLGNTQPGDGVKFKGRGLMMTTGRNNYADFSDTIEEDVVAHPQLLSEFPLAAVSAGFYWREGAPINGSINSFCDTGDEKEAVRKISAAVNYPAAIWNKGRTHIINHLKERGEWFERASVVFGAGEFATS